MADKLRIPALLPLMHATAMCKWKWLKLGEGAESALQLLAYVDRYSGGTFFDV
jgi:hypothetical protein